jgi:hypothetical protein
LAWFNPSSPGNLLGENLEQEVNGEMDKLFGEDRSSLEGNKKPAESTAADGAVPISGPGKSVLLSVEDAIQAGIIPDHRQEDGFPATLELN